MTTETETTYTVRVECWSGAVRPYRARVLASDGTTVAVTGGCASRSAALRKGRELAQRLAAAEVL